MSIVERFVETIYIYRIHPYTNISSNESVALRSIHLHTIYTVPLFNVSFSFMVTLSQACIIYFLHDSNIKLILIPEHRHTSSFPYCQVAQNGTSSIC